MGSAFRVVAGSSVVRGIASRFVAAHDLGIEEDQIRVVAGSDASPVHQTQEPSRRITECLNRCLEAKQKQMEATAAALFR